MPPNTKVEIQKRTLDYIQLLANPTASVAARSIYLQGSACNETSPHLVMDEFSHELQQRCGDLCHLMSGPPIMKPNFFGGKIKPY